MKISVVMGWDNEVGDICEAQRIIYQGFSLLTANQDVLPDLQVWDIAKRVGGQPSSSYPPFRSSNWDATNHWHHRGQGNFYVFFWLLS